MELDKKLEILDKIESIVDEYHGSAPDLYSALGVFVVGEHLGWQTLRITLGRGTYAKYQKILGMDFKKTFPKRGVYARKSLALKIVDKTSDAVDYFWSVVKGHTTMDSVERKTLVSNMD